MVGRQIESITEGLSLREAGARVALRAVLRQGHVYVELRHAGKATIFLCVLCQSPCFNENVLDDHLNGNVHTRRLAAAKVTLYGPNPWPFRDGALFFDTTGKEVLESIGFGDSSSRVVADETKDNNNTLRGHCIFVPGVLRKKKDTIKARFVGYGHIGARICEVQGSQRYISRTWCAWLGREESDECKELLTSPKCDFAIICFPYTNALGKSCLDDVDGARFFEIDELGHRGKKRKRSSSAAESSSEAQAEGSNRLETSKLIPNKSDRKDLRKHRHITAERICYLCCKDMVLGKDVAALLNCKTGKFACSSRNRTGAFHVYHISCLIHWILLCESEAWIGQPSMPKRRGRKAKLAPVFCPQCQGTGIRTVGGAFERLKYRDASIPEMQRLKQKMIKAHNSWMKTPEVLGKCSTGLQFPSDFVGLQVQENVMSMKLIDFYRAEE